DPTPVRPFGFGLSYADIRYDDLVVSPGADAGGAFEAAVTVENASDVASGHVVQLYGRDLVAEVTRPVAQLLAYQRVQLGPRERRRVTFRVPTQRFAFTGRDGRRIVEPGDVEVWVAPDAASDERAGATPRARVEIRGPVHGVGPGDDRVATARVA